MNKAEAIHALDAGHRLTHRLFGEGQFIKKDGIHYQDEKGYTLNVERFWKYRSTIWWTTDWVIYHEQKTKA